MQEREAGAGDVDRTRAAGLIWAEEVKQAFADSAPFLREFQHGLKAGVLRICAQCDHYEFGAKVVDLGVCRTLRERAWPFMPFRCEAFVRRKKAA